MDRKDWIVGVGQIIAAVVTSAAFTPLIQAFFARPKNKVDMTAEFQKMSIDWAKSFSAETEEARKETEEARQETRLLRLEVNRATQEVIELTNQMRALRAAIFRSDVTIDELRHMVSRYSREENV
jgi:septal ring factor EnvC (AmiA/AmiB activator)